MKSEHRHELKTNELAEWIVNFPKWFRENSRTISIALAVVICVAGYWLWYNYREKNVQTRKQLNYTRIITTLADSKINILLARAQQAAGKDFSYLLVQAADVLQGTAESAENHTKAALAFIKCAEALRMDLHSMPEPVAEDKVASQIGHAKEAYKEALKIQPLSASLTAKAKLGLGLCEEELGNFEKARNVYSDIAADESIKFTTAAAAAEMRLKIMGDYEKDVVFKPAPEPNEAELPEIGTLPLIEDVCAIEGVEDYNLEESLETIPATGTNLPNP